MSETTELAAGLVDVAVLDDDGDFRTYIEDLLRDEGFYSVERSLIRKSYLHRPRFGVPDIVLLDMKMGGATGEEVIERLLSRWPDLCIIIVTGYPSLESMRTTFKLRVFDYLAKPFSLSQLRQVLQNAVRAVQPWDKLRRTACASAWATGSSCCASSATGR